MTISNHLYIYICIQLAYILKKRFQKALVHKLRMLSNKQIVLKNYIQGCPKESDFELRTTPLSTEIPQNNGSKNAVLLKILYLACDPYLCHILRPRTKSLFVFSPVIPGSVFPKGHRHIL
ncbi:hypothetical protein ACP275_08G201900 [Erythranthe tilingii]